MAKDTRVSGSEFYLDTASFDEAAKLCIDLAEKMTSLKNNMDGKKNNLMFSTFSMYQTFLAMSH